MSTAVSCPYFYPTERAVTVAWAFPARLPLGAGFCGNCRATGAESAVSDHDLREHCNLGYAGGCSRLPADRRADCVRFTVASDEGIRITLHYIYERAHAPVEWGKLEYDCVAANWVSALDDAVVQRQAECYVGVYLERRPRATAASRSL